MSSHFSRTQGGLTMYFDGDDGTPVRFILLRHGEDTTKALEVFWKEHRQSGNQAQFDVCPLFAFGKSAPRRDLSTKASITAALPTAIIPKGSHCEQQWRLVCAHFGVPFDDEPEVVAKVVPPKKKARAA